MSAAHRTTGAQALRRLTTTAGQRNLRGRDAAI